MANTVYIAERRLSARRLDGKSFEIDIGVGKPFPRDGTEAWDCPVKVDGLYKRLANITGCDSWQSLQLARNLIIQLLTSFIQDGGKLYYFDNTEEPITLEDIREFF